MHMNYQIFTLFVAFVIVSGVQAHSQEEQLECSTPIQLRQGWVQGEEFTSTDDIPFCSYRGLPYAEPPLQELRFKPPKRAGRWTGILNATKDGAKCPQFVAGVIQGNEDCLTLNVYTPKGFRNFGNHTHWRLPVMFFIHGGGFVNGDGGFHTYPPHRFMNEKVVCVVIQYRLGIFGFLSTASQHVSGNWGLLDQRKGLKWVKENIEEFGGDPGRVVIFGESAGAGSVMYQMVSRGSKGLFHGVIDQSGTVLNHWSIQPDPRPYALKLGEELGCDINDLCAMVACLRTKEVQEIFGVMVANKWLSTATGPFVPVLENPEYSKFIHESPYKLLEDGDISDVHLIIGCNRDEVAIIFYGLPEAAAFNTIDDTYYNVSQPALIQWGSKLNDSLLEKSYQVKAEY